MTRSPALALPRVWVLDSDLLSGGWIRAVTWFAAIKIAAGLSTLGYEVFEDPEILATRLPLFAAYLLIFSGAAALLAIRSRPDEPAWLLGGSFLLVASAWADAPITRFALSWDGQSSPAFLADLQVVAFLPYFVWLFVAAFPAGEVLGRARVGVRTGARVSLFVGLVLFVVNLLIGIGLSTSALPLPFAALRRTAMGAYWPVLYSLIAAALGVALWRSRRVAVGERRRVALFITAIVIGSAPMLFMIIGGFLSPRVAAVWDHPRGSFIALAAVDLGLLSIPLTTAYAVLVHRVLDLGFVLRRALRYALGRHGIAMVTAIPFAMLLVLLYQSRDQSLRVILLGPQALGLAALTLVGLAALRVRSRLLTALDERFFRREYDAREILSGLIDRTRKASSAKEVSRLVRQDLERALHPLSTGIFLGNSSADLVEVAELARPFKPEFRLWPELEARRAPIEIDLSLSDESGALAENEKLWLTDAGYQLLVPLLGADGTLLGLLALGERASELPYSRDDRLLLTAIGEACAVAIEARLLARETDEASAPLGVTAATRTTPRPSRPVPKVTAEPQWYERPGWECQRCGLVDSAERPTCSSCEGKRRPNGLPSVLLGKFRFLQRIGEGGMGVVYRARDLGLSRDVAIKTLPRVSGALAVRLRREARAIASVTHPNLALIYGSESWNGTPLLVLELLAGGSLDDRLKAGPLPIEDALMIGVKMSSVLGQVHERGILHRDVKPSNIGYTEDGTPKLLDFGLAKLILEARSSSPPGPAVRCHDEPASPVISGTLPYLSPEALARKRPDYSLDLWALNVSLFEAICGNHPFSGRSSEETMQRIRGGWSRRLGDQLPLDRPELRDLFASTLSASPRRRPATARDLAGRLAAAAATGSTH